MSNLFGIGLSGLNAAQAGLSTTSSNISNVNTPGYTRRSAQLAESVASNTGSGVEVTAVKRDYAQFLTGQLNTAQSKASATSSHLDQISQIDNLLGDPAAGLAPLMQKFFSGVQTVAGDPSDTAARASLLGNANSLASQFRSFAGTFKDMSESVDSQVRSAVGQVNNNAQQIASLNTQIQLTRARTGAEPNRLLDQRDQLLADLSKTINVDVSQSNDGSINLTVGGQPLVDATGSHELVATPSPDDASRQVVAYKSADGSLRPLDPSRIAGGSIGGLLAFRDNSLAPAQQRLDQLAHDFAAAVNDVQAQGKDLSGKDGQPLFSTGAPQSVASANNTGNAALTVSFAAGKTADIAASNYRVDFTQSGYQVTRLSDGKQVVSDATSTPLSFGGVKVSVDGTSPSPQPGDSFLVKPLDGAANSFDVATDDPAAIAAAGAGGQPGDNSNALELADLQNANIVEGNRSFNDDYAQLVGDIGNKTASLKVSSDAQTSLTTELTSAQQSVSGVNLDEENVNLLYYQQMYQANAKVIQTASTLFDTLLGIRS